MAVELTLNPAEVAALAAEFESASATEILQWAYGQFGSSAAIGTSFQGAGLVTIHHAVNAGLPLPVFTIDTGLLFPETLELKNRLEKYFGIVIESLVPERTVEEQALDIAPEQSAGRSQVGILELFEFDKLREKNILKVSPLARWSRDEVWAYIRHHGIPYNPLMDRGFRSIGCHPCTRVVISGQDDRAGRWTGFDKSECGIHTFLGDKI
jgi:phosphoadenosine phosphosulfate reductase